MKKLLIISIVLLVGLNESCVVVNITKNVDNSQCHLHNVKMKKRLVGTQYGRYVRFGNKSEYHNARVRKPMGCVVPVWPKRRLAIIYVCKECNKVKRKLKRKTHHQLTAS